jgi:hypothetical protein
MSLQEADMNLKMILVAIENRIRISVVPRRTHTVAGIPILFESDTKRLYIETQSKVESVLLGEVAHFMFPKSLYNQVIKQPAETPVGKPFPDYAVPPEKPSGAQLKSSFEAGKNGELYTGKTVFEQRAYEAGQKNAKREEVDTNE